MALTDEARQQIDAHLRQLFRRWGLAVVSALVAGGAGLGYSLYSAANAAAQDAARDVAQRRVDELVEDLLDPQQIERDADAIEATMQDVKVHAALAQGQVDQAIQGFERELEWYRGRLDMATEGASRAEAAVDELSGRLATLDKLVQLESQREAIITEVVTAIRADSMEQLIAEQAEIPAGFLVASAAGDQALPPGRWLPCDGRFIDLREPGQRELYGDLHAAIGHTWGDGGDRFKETFRIPDLRGMFLRGADDRPAADGTGRDPDRPRAVGSVQLDAGQEHTHQDAGHSHAQRLARSPGDLTVADPAHNEHAIDSVIQTGVGRAQLGGMVATGTDSVRAASETRPVNVAVTWWIRY